LTLTISATFITSSRHALLAAREQDQEWPAEGGPYFYHCRARPFDPPAFRFYGRMPHPRILNLTVHDLTGRQIPLTPLEQGAWTLEATVPVRLPSEVAAVEFDLVTGTEERSHTFEFKDVTLSW
jgi:hypothetical protein